MTETITSTLIISMTYPYTTTTLDSGQQWQYIYTTSAGEHIIILLLVTLLTAWVFDFLFRLVYRR